jgi:hypothetical protein
VFARPATLCCSTCVSRCGSSLAPKAT